jgi:hypothetical protein
MSSVEETVRFHIQHYPSMLDSRTSVLHQVLCSIGGGYKWKKGEAVYESMRETIPWDPTPPKEQWKKELGKNYLLARIAFKKDYDELVAEHKREKSIIENIDTLVTFRKDTVINHFYAQFYVQTEYALLMNIPANVTPDWKEACEEIKELAVKNGWIF